jgi:preprotein translocase subunit YajC
MKRIFFIIIIFLTAFLQISAQQNNTGVEMAEGMRRSGKIYVVIAVILTIFAGIIFYLIRLERKLNKLEKQNQNNYK